MGIICLCTGQADIFRRQGVELSRQTMCDWMRALRADLVSPLYELMKHRVLGSKAVQTDDTPVPVLDPALPRTRTGRIWTYVGDDEHPYTVYDYTPTRSRDGPEAFLEEFRDISRPTPTPGMIISIRNRNAESPRSHVGRIQGGAFLKRSLRT